MHDARADVPGFAPVNRLTWLSAFQHSEIAFQQVSSIKAGMCVKSAIHMWLHLDKHDHCFVAAIWHIKPFQNRPRDGFWHDKASRVTACLRQAEVYQECPWDQKARSAPPT